MPFLIHLIPVLTGITVFFSSKKRFNFNTQQVFQWLKKGCVKKILFLIFSFVLSDCVFSQDTGRDILHAALTPNKGSKTVTAVAIPAVPELLMALQKSITVPQKIDLLYNIAAGYLNNLKIDSALFYAQKIKIIADSAGYGAGLAKYFLARGSALFYRNKGDEVKQNLQQAITLFTKYDNHLFLGISYHQLARQLAHNNDYTGAQQLYRRAVPLIAAAGDVNRLQWAVHNFGRNFFFTFELDSSVYYLSWALKLAEQLKNELKIFNSASMLGEVYLVSNNIKDAEQNLHYALSIPLPPSADKIQLRGVMANYAEVLILQDKYGAATQAIKEYDNFNAFFGDLSGKMTEKKLKGSLLYHQGNYNEALHYLQDAYKLKIADKLFSHSVMGIAANLGKTELKTGSADSAIVHFRLAKDLATQSNYIAGVLDANILLAEAFQQNNRMDSAYHYFRNYSHLRDSVLTFKKERTVMELSAKYDAEKREQEIKSLEADQQIFTYQLQLKNTTIEQQQLLGLKNSQQLALLTQQSEISRLQASEKNLALQNREKEFVKKQKEVKLLQKEKQLQSALAAKEAQQKNLLFVITGAILLFVMYGMYRYRQNKQLNRRLAQSLTDLKQAQEQLIKTEKEKEAENVRLRISRDIHDEVGATLSGVALFSQIAKQKMLEHKEKEAVEYLQYISDNSKEMVEKMSDIIWTINPKNDSFERIIFKLQAYAMNICEGKGIQLYFDIDEILRAYSPSMQARKNIYLLVKEAINNAVKYSDAKNIFFSMKKETEIINIGVKDDGKGFVVNGMQAGNGIGNMKVRAKELDAFFTIDSQPGKGTIVRLEFNFHPMEVQVG
jgi:two-component system, NarL family, sensor histidine kinase UhpB